MAPRSKVTVLGAKEVTANLAMAGKRWMNSVRAGLYLEANNVMAVSKRRVPVDLGTLKASGYVTIPQESGGKIMVEIGYGGAGSKDYAAVQHERLDFKHPEGGQAKYLESVIDERSPQMAQNILKLAKAHFERGAGLPAESVMPTDPDQGEGRAAAEAIGKVLRKLGGSPRKRGGR